MTWKATVMRDYNKQENQFRLLSEQAPGFRDFWEDYELAIVALERFSRSPSDPRAIHYAELLNEFTEEISQTLDQTLLDPGHDEIQSTRLLELVK